MSPSTALNAVFCSITLTVGRVLKDEKHFTDKDFLEQECFTPDCEGQWVKVEFFDKKGDVNKQFVSEAKKEMKTKWAKWDKKPETKEFIEKKKKKTQSSRSGSLESEQAPSRKTSNASEVSDQLNQKANPVTESALHVPYDKVKVDISCKNDLEEERPLSSCSSASEVSSFAAKMSSAFSPEVVSGMKKNVFSFMFDFLQLHGPLKIDEPMLLKELSFFPEEACAMIAEYGGLGKFLVNDLRFAFVGDTYICVTADLGKAYKLNSGQSLPPEVNYKSMISENCFDGSGDASLKSFSLNPDACEYKPPSQTSESGSTKIPSNTILTDRKFVNDNGNLRITKTFSSKFGLDQSSAMTAEELGSKLRDLLDLYFSASMEEQRSAVDSFIESYCIMKAKDLNKIECEKQETLQVIQDLHVRNGILVEHKDLLQSHLNSTKRNSQELLTDINVLKIKIASLSSELEKQKQEFTSKEKASEESKTFVFENLSKAYETIDKQKEEIANHISENKSLSKNVNEFKATLQSTEDKYKNALSNQEREHSAQIKLLQDEIAELKNKLQQTDLKILYLKKTVHIKKIEDKHTEAVKYRESLSGLSVMGGSLPAMQANTIQLDKHILTYIDQLTAIKLDFVYKIDDLIERVKSGAFLMDLKEVEMIDLPSVPTFESLGLMPSKSNQGANNFVYNSCLGTYPPGFSSVSPVLSPVPLTPVLPTMAAASTLKLPFSHLNIKKSVATANSIDLIDKSKASGIKPESIPSGVSLASLTGTISKNITSRPTPSQSPVSYVMDKPKAPAIKPDSVLSSVSLSSLTGTISKNITSATTPSPSPASYEKNDLKSDLSSSGNLNLRKENDVDISQYQASAPEAKSNSSKNSWGKLLKMCQESYPSYSPKELMSFIEELRSRRQGKLTGQSLTKITSEVGLIIQDKMAAERKANAAGSCSQQNKISKTLVNKKLIPEPKASEEQSVKTKKPAWKVNSASPWTSPNHETSCIICYEELIEPYKVLCGHVFHEACIKKWLQKKSDCPICRVLLLLPEEYPSLS